MNIGILQAPVWIQAIAILCAAVILFKYGKGFILRLKYLLNRVLATSARNKLLENKVIAKLEESGVLDALSEKGIASIHYLGLSRMTPGFITEVLKDNNNYIFELDSERHGNVFLFIDLMRSTRSTKWEVRLNERYPIEPDQMVLLLRMFIDDFIQYVNAKNKREIEDKLERDRKLASWAEP